MPFFGPLGGERARDAGDLGPDGGLAGETGPREFTPPDTAGEESNRLTEPRGESCLDGTFRAGERERGRDGG
jgi:hypothetical protein